MSNIAPSPSSSSSGEHDNGSDNNSDSKGAPRPPSNSRGEPSESPPSPSSSGGGSRSSPSSDSQDSSSSSPPSPSGNSPPSRSSPSPSSQPSPKSPPPPSSSNGGNSNYSPPPSPPSNSSPADKGSSNSPQNSGSSSSSPPPGKSPSPPQPSGGSSPSPPPPPSPSPPQSPPTQSGDESSSSSASAPPPRSSSAPPQKSNSGESSSQPSPPRTPSSSSPSPPPPTNQSVVFVPVLVLPNGPPGALSPPGSVAISPGSSVSSQVANAGGQQVPGSSGTSNSGDGSSTNSDMSQSSLASSRVGTSHVAAAIAGATITGLMFVVVAVFLVVMRRKKKRSPDGLVYHNDGSYYVYSGQLGRANNQSGMLHHPPPPGASAGFSHGPASGGADNAGGGYYLHQSGIMESKSSFSYEELTSITSNFSRDNVIGEGGFGCVYKGWLANGKCVAVKQLKAGSGQGECEFQAEVEIISRVHHRHLVSLVGYCVAAHHRMLIYEFVPNGTLEHHLHDRGVPVMDWPTRLRIAIGAAKGLAYLHEDCHPRIIHRDIKSANILLDYSFEAQVADFGLAKLSNDTHTHVSTRIMGTFGYLAPEYASSGKLTDRSDVFSFGVVLLELITGRKPVDQTRPPGDESLVEWARPVLAHAVDTGDLDALVDSRLDGAYNRGEMMVMVEAAAACVRHSAPKRPRMVQVMRALDDDAGGMSDLSNGVKVGQSRAYGSGNHLAAVQQLRLTAFASEEFTREFQRSREYGGSTDDSETRLSGDRGDGLESGRVHVA